MENKQRLQFSIGPVQGFVARSRRTRDLWSSSFLLSHLAAKAITAVLNAGGRLILPHTGSLSEQGNHGFGTIPNRFVAEFEAANEVNARERAGAAADMARSALLNEWKNVAEAVWNQFLNVVTRKPDMARDTRNIWDRQVDSFWEISWVVGSTVESSGLLGSRKNWRTTPATVEPGDHCTMMGDRQELSGWIRSREKQEQDEFWKFLRRQPGMGKLDLGDDERLCAIAMIKRLFPKVAQAAIGRHLKHTNWPSTAYIAAIPWMVEIASCEKSQVAAANYACDVKLLAENSLDERHSMIPELQRLKDQKRTGDFLNLDGNFFQRNAISNERVTPLEELRDGETDKQARHMLQKQLSELCHLVDGRPSAFYAVLLMDGDSMGELLSAARKAQPNDGESRASEALSWFSKEVPKVVGKQLGVTIYAGGDDVLAMLPLETALKCAMQLADSYQAAFKPRLGEDTAKRATLSGAIVYAHYHTPLGDVLRTAHHLLDDVAKDATGRDSLAIAVYKSSGITAQWAAPWDHIRKVSDDAKADNIIESFLFDLNKNRSHNRTLETDSADSQSAEFSSGFLYNLRERFAALTDKPLTTPGEFGKLSPELTTENHDLLRSVLVADYMRSKQHLENRHADGSKKSESELHAERQTSATNAIKRLLELSQRVTRKQVSGSEPAKFKLEPEPNTLGIDGALLVRFLACDGKEDSE